MKICGSSVPYHVRNAVPALPSGNTVPFLLRNQMQETPLRKEATVFCQPAAVPRLSPLLPAANETWNTGIHSHANQKGISAQPVFYYIKS